jgi:quinolinate synthase
MAETAKILNPDKKVLLPDINAGCYLDESCPADEFKKFIKKYPDHKVVSYINCSTEVKTLSDVICTSSNAIKIVESFPKTQKIIFAPDKNLGAYVNKKTGRNMVLWDGVCDVHNKLSKEDVLYFKGKYPDAKLVAHPECDISVLKLADFVGSTTGMLNYTKKDYAKKYLVATETGVTYQMKKDSPGKKFITVTKDKTKPYNYCPYMKLNTLENLYMCIKNEYPEVILPKEIMEKAKVPILRMLEISKKIGC